MISPKELILDSFEYLIINSKIYFNEIKKEAIKLGIEQNRIIDGEIFRMTFFDFGRYKKLLENPVTILSDDCKLGNEEKV